MVDKLEYATLYVVDIGDVSDASTLISFFSDPDSHYDDTLLEYLSRLFQSLVSSNKIVLDDVEDGDMLEVSNLSGYRSDGVFMFHRTSTGVTLVELNYTVDDYGSPSTVFTFPQFHPKYWDYDKIRIVGGTPESRWHSINPPVVCDQILFDWYGVGKKIYYGIYKDYILLTETFMVTLEAYRYDEKKVKRIMSDFAPQYITSDNILENDEYDPTKLNKFLEQHKNKTAIFDFLTL